MPFSQVSAPCGSCGCMHRGLTLFGLGMVGASLPLPFVQSLVHADHAYSASRVHTVMHGARPTVPPRTGRYMHSVLGVTHTQAHGAAAASSLPEAEAAPARPVPQLGSGQAQARLPAPGNSGSALKAPLARRLPGAGRVSEAQAAAALPGAIDALFSQHHVATLANIRWGCRQPRAAAATCGGMNCCSHAQACSTWMRLQFW